MSDVINGVPRELLESIVNTNVADYEVIYQQKKELRALLTAQPQASADPLSMLDLRVAAKAASPWEENSERTGAFVKGALWHAQQASAAQSAPSELAAAVRVLLEVPQLQGDQAYSARSIIDRVRSALSEQSAPAGERGHED